MSSIAIRKQSRFLADMTIYLRICLSITAFLAVVELGLIWFGTSQQTYISTTLTYSGRERSYTQKLVADSMNVVYAHTSMNNLATDLAMWSSYHDAIWSGNPGLHVLSVSQYPDILPTVSGVEKNYTEMHGALSDILSSTPALMRNIALVNADSVPVYNAMDAYNTYLRGLTTTYQTQIWFFGLTLTISILITLILSYFVVFRPAMARLRRNVVDIADANAATLKKTTELQFVLDEIRYADQAPHNRVKRISSTQYRVQGSNESYLVVKGLNKNFYCPCFMFQHNGSCLHAKHAKSADEQPAS